MEVRHISPVSHSEIEYSQYGTETQDTQHNRHWESATPIKMTSNNLYFILVLCFAVLSVLELTSLLSLGDIAQNVLLSLGLLGSLHHTLTFCLMTDLPEARELRKRIFGASQVYFWLTVLFIFITLTIAMAYLFNVVIIGWKLPFIVALTGQYLVDGYISFHHLSRQTLALAATSDFSFGLSLSYIKQKHRLERKLVFGISIFLFITMMSRAYGWELWTSVLSGCMSALLVGALLALQLKTPRSYPKMKFLSRSMLWPVFGWSVFSTSLIKVLHAVEAYSVFNSIARSSKLNIRKKLYWALVAWTIPYIVLISFNSRGVFYRLSSSEGSDVLALSLLPVFLSMGLMHVIFESFMYKMRKPEVRETMGRFFTTREHL